MRGVDRIFHDDIPRIESNMYNLSLLFGLFDIFLIGRLTLLVLVPNGLLNQTPIARA